MFFIFLWESNDVEMAQDGKMENELVCFGGDGNARMDTQASGSVILNLHWLSEFSMNVR